ncbi:LEM domain-containing protein 1 isoform X1 [Archocentrus centrarchus]|uniref:LEM domain-containing protein 1 isoform X1 n=1 Tax=Archocentrus centrarchus TaxID=63155 RepID=UPI0011E9EACD|nr:lamina-associated polypeptide 2, isoforms beta/gamma-like isoform X1 [Archocentrus centrarchus]
MPFVEDAAHLSKTRLKSDLVAHNVALPPAASKKEVYVELHLKHIHQKNAANFSSDEDDCVEEVPDKKDPDDAEMPVPSSLTDDDLKAALLKRGVKAGPIVASTRALYERKLQKLLQSDRHKRLNEAAKAVLYSDSEEEENQEEDEESRSEQQMRDQPDKTEQESSQNHVFYPQCFLPSSKLRACPRRNMESSSNWNSRNVLKSSEWSQSNYSQISRTSSADHHTGLGSRVSQEPVRYTLKDILLDNKTEQTGIYVTCRRPIKGAAQRPVQYAYPGSPVSPTTQRRQEVERHLVPIHIQILVFLIVACVLYLLYVNVEDC